MATPPQNAPDSAPSWQLAAVVAIQAETENLKTVTIRVPERRRFDPGQLFEVRLTAPEGFQRVRRYYVCSAPEDDGGIRLAIERREEDFVAAYFHDRARPSDVVQTRGPIDSGMAWRADLGGPLLLVAGGLGMAPMISMLHHRRRASPEVGVLVLGSACDPALAPYLDTLSELAQDDPRLEVEHVFTQSRALGRLGFSKRFDRAALKAALRRLDGEPRCYVCGSPSFLETMREGLESLKVEPSRIQTAVARYDAV